MKRVVLHLTLIVGAAATLAPLIWMVAASFMPAGQATTYPPHFIPRPATLENYRILFTRLDVARNLLNSVIVSFAATGLSSMINAMAGYAFAKFRFRGRDSIFKTLLAGLVTSASRCGRRKPGPRRSPTGPPTGRPGRR